MDKRVIPFVGSRQSDLKKTFKLAIRSLLTACSKEEFVKAFSGFTVAEQEHLHRLFIQVITKLHQSIEEEFEGLCLETQVEAILDTVEQRVEEQSLDPLFSKKINFIDVARDLSLQKKNEIHHLEGMLNKVIEQKRNMQAQIEVLKSRMGEFSNTNTTNIEKLRSITQTNGLMKTLTFREI